jgi:L-threonylcarbamoyladenylate synthase
MWITESMALTYSYFDMESELSWTPTQIVDNSKQSVTNASLKRNFCHLEKIVSWIVSGSFENVKECAKILKGGGLVAFPTETVYGLGASIFSESALLKVFEFKGRPFTNPLIVHLNSSSQIPLVAALSSNQGKIVRVLSQAFWPGPFTMILPSNSGLSPMVNSGTDTVAVRMPNHPLALSLLSEAEVPVAAPSANLFGHVSPTTAQHVLEDFPENDLAILDGGQTSLGVESTVVKILDNQIVVLRKGPIGLSEIKTVISKSGLNVSLSVQNKIVSNFVDFSQESPGQMLTHYAPRIPCKVLESSEKNGHSLEGILTAQAGLRPASVAFVDFGGHYSAVSKDFAAYFDLSKTSNALEALFNAFVVLRKCERVEGIQLIILPNFNGSSDEKLQALADRFLRASSGQFLK